MAKLKLLADGWRQIVRDDQGRRVGFRRHKRGDIVEVDDAAVERFLSMGRRNRPVFEEVKATEENKSSTSSTQTVQRSGSTTSDKKS